MEPLAASLSGFERKLKKNRKMEITNEEANSVVKRVVDAIGVGKNEPVGVSLSAVHTYVHQLDKTTNTWGSPSIIIPPFACHWGIVVGPSESQTLFHLLLVEGAGEEVGTSRVENKYIRFHHTSLHEPLANTKYVGQTRYNTDQLNALGRAMIREFGNYHKVFWNCQTFAKCFLRVITGDDKVNFDSWTAADTSRLFLCAFLVGTPLATTRKVKEKM